MNEIRQISPNPNPNPSKAKPGRSLCNQITHHLLLCNRPRSRVRPAIRSSCFLISRKFEKPLLADSTGIPAAVTGTGTTEELAAIFLPLPRQPITGDDTGRPSALKEIASYWTACPPEEPIPGLLSEGVVNRLKTKALIGQELLGRES